MAVCETAVLGISHRLRVGDLEAPDHPMVEIETEPDGTVTFRQGDNVIVVTPAQLYALVWELK